MRTNNKRMELKREFSRLLQNFANAFQEFEIAREKFENEGKELKRKIYEEDIKDVEELIGKHVSQFYLDQLFVGPDSPTIERIDSILPYEDDLNDLLSPPKYTHMKVTTTNMSNGKTKSFPMCKDSLVGLLMGREESGYTLVEHKECVKEKESKETRAEKDILYSLAKELFVGKTLVDDNFVKDQSWLGGDLVYYQADFPKYDAFEAKIYNVFEQNEPCCSHNGSPDGKVVSFQTDGLVKYKLRSKDFKETLINLLAGLSVKLDGDTHSFWIKEYKEKPILKISPNGSGDYLDWFNMNAYELSGNIRRCLANEKEESIVSQREGIEENYYEYTEEERGNTVVETKESNTEERPTISDIIEEAKKCQTEKEELYSFAKEILVGKTITDYGVVGFETPKKSDNPNVCQGKESKYGAIESVIEDVLETEGPPCWSDIGSPDGKQVTIKCSNGKEYNLNSMRFRISLINLVRGLPIACDHFTHRFWVKEFKAFPLIPTSDKVETWDFDVWEDMNIKDLKKLVRNHMSDFQKLGELERKIQQLSDKITAM